MSSGRWTQAVVCAALVAAALATHSPVRACGGGVAAPKSATVSIAAQRAFYSVRSNGSTDVVVQLHVQGGSDYGVLLPLPTEPWIDPQPVDSSELDRLDEATRVTITETPSASEGGGCGCGSAADEAGGGASPRNGGVVVGSFVDVGPVTAVALSATSSDALLGWLADNGFTIPAADQGVVDGYLGPESWFLAFKRSAAGAAGDSSIGAHFVLPGDTRGYPLRIARLGAAPELAITAFVVAKAGVAPASPFTALTLRDLSGVEIDADGQAYREAIAQAVSTRSGHAFLLEGVFDLAEEPQVVDTARLSAMIDPGSKLTRLTTIVSRDQLDQDTAFTADAPAEVPRSLEVGAAWLPPIARHVPPENRRFGYGLAVLLLPLLVTIARRLASRRRWAKARLALIPWCNVGWRALGAALLATGAGMATGCFIPLDECESADECHLPNVRASCNPDPQSAEEQCVFEGCEEGFADLDHDVLPMYRLDSESNGCECAKTNGGLETVDGADNDCNGIVDDLCEPTNAGVEIADGIDNDCNGKVDDDACVASAEVCDGIDNDCDGEVDELFDLASDPRHCGACGHDCDTALQGAVTACVRGECVLVFCKKGFEDADMDPTNGCEVGAG